MDAADVGTRPEQLLDQHLADEAGRSRHEDVLLRVELGDADHLVGKQLQRAARNVSRRCTDVAL